MTHPLTAFDADVLIYAATVDHPLGQKVRPLLADGDTEDGPAGVGSVLLLPEVLTKPMRADPESIDTMALISLLSRLELWSLDEATARLALALATSYGLRAADAVHLATAIRAGAQRFLTNNHRDFPKTISEIDVVYPDELGS